MYCIPYIICIYIHFETDRTNIGTENNCKQILLNRTVRNADATFHHQMLNI